MYKSSTDSNKLSQLVIVIAHARAMIVLPTRASTEFSMQSNVCFRIRKMTAPGFACLLPLLLTANGCSNDASNGDSAATGGMAGDGGGGTSGDNSGGGKGQGGDGQGGSDPVLPVEPGTGPNGFSCSPAGIPFSPGMRRLGSVQYRNTIRDLLSQSVGTNADSVMLAVAKEIALYPADARPAMPKDKHGAYRRMDQDVQDLHVEAAYRVAFAVAEQLTKPALLGVLVGTCATDADAQNDADCISAFVKNFGARAFRRPLDADELKFFRGFYTDATGINSKAVAETIAGIMMAPRFLYLVENGAAAVDGKANVFSLDNYELASRLSYQYLQSMPDKELLDAAGAGQLTTPDGFSKQLDRLLKDPRARTTFDEFFADYLKLDDLPFIDKVEEFKYRSFAGGDLPGPATRTNVINDVLALTRYVAWDKSGVFADLLLDEHSFATTDDVAKLYKIAKWSGNGEPPKFPAGTRPGVLTRVALLATGMVVTRPIMKGVFIRHNILCDEIPPPPNNAQNATITQGLATTRTMVERVTQQAGTACATCHANLINPLGFATEGFDSLGRSRTDEIFYNGDSGLETKRFPVNTKAVPRITDEDQREAAGPADLAKFIVESKKANACFARHVFRFTFGRWESLDENDHPAPVDGCVLERLRKVADDRPIATVFREIALTPEFKQRTFKP